MWKFIIVALVTFSAVGILSDNFSRVEDHLIVKRQSNFEFIILHNNDMHARFEQTNMKSGTCSKDDAKKNKCCGGYGRVANMWVKVHTPYRIHIKELCFFRVRKYRKAADSGGLPVIFLNAGDVYTGTAWFTIFKHEIVTDFMNKLAPDAIVSYELYIILSLCYIHP